MTEINYSHLFSVELLHKFTTDNKCNDFTIVPSAATARLLNDYRIIVKQNENVLHTLIQLDPAGLASTPPVQKPFIVPAEGLQLTFYMTLNNPLFFNYTSLAAANNNGNIYYFTNRNANSSNNKNFLSASLGFTAGVYSLEDLVISGSSVYESLINSNSDNPAVITSWRQVMYPNPANSAQNIPDPNRFMSQRDLIQWMPAISTQSLLSAIPVINVQITDHTGSTITLPPVFNTENLMSFTLNLSSLQKGKYKLQINDGSEPRFIYLDDELSNAQIFGVIDIFVESTLAAHYLILNQDPAHKDELLSPTYSIYFLNRATIWKYILLRSDGTINITDSSNIYKFSQPLPHTSPTTILSDFSIPLNEAPVGSLILDGKSPPSATPYRLSYNTADSNDTHYFSEIYLNY